MNCEEAEPYASALYDGQRIPETAAQHIGECATCQTVLSDYARMTVELRLEAAQPSPSLPPLALPARRRWFDTLRNRVAVPRFALAALVISAVAGVAAASLLHAQPKPLWFEFGYSFSPGEPFNFQAAKAGFDQTFATLGPAQGQMQAASLRVNIESIDANQVTLRAAAAPARTQVTQDGIRLVGGPIGGISLDTASLLHYTPGQPLAIPVEGGETIYLKGYVVDHRPEIASGTPLLPINDKLNLRSPVLVRSNELIYQQQGASSIVDGTTEATYIETSKGVFTFALRPFPEAVEGQAEWGELDFKIGDEQYRLLANAPITGGDQPRPVWVRFEVQPDWGPHCGSMCIGSSPIPK